jgi:hypothetical protein
MYEYRNRTRSLFSNVYRNIPGVYGSTRAAQFIKDVAARQDSVDILIAGDSNTNFGGTGWVDGINLALQTNTTAVEYGSPIVPCISWDSAKYYGVYVEEGCFSSINAAGTVVNAAGTPALGNTLVSGRASGPSDLTNAMTRGAGTLQPNTCPFDYGWWAGTNDWSDTLGGMYAYVGSGRLTWIGDAIQYRVVHGRGPSMGTLRLASRLDVAPFTSNGTQSVSCAQATYEWTTSTLSIAANSSRTGQQHSFAYASNAISTSRLTGPMAIALQSISRINTKGYSVTSISHHGGASMDTVASNISSGSTVVRQYLREARLRQISCGGSGRVIAAIQGGINSGVNPWATSASSFFATCRTEWATLGYPADDLACLGWVSHQSANPDTLTAERASSIALGQTGSCTIVDMTAFVSFNDINTGGGSGTTWYDSGGNSHLTTAGYQAIGGRIISALLL